MPRDGAPSAQPVWIDGGSPTGSGETDIRIGPTNEAAAATDTATSGLNGLLKRIAQRLTSVIALLPGALGQGTMAQSLRVVPASDWTQPKADFLTVTGTGNIQNATPIAATDVGGYRWVSVQITGSFTATCTFEVSNDNATWVSAVLVGTTSTTGIATATVTTATMLHGPIGGRYFRVRISAISNGSVGATAVFTPMPAALTSQGVTAIGQSNSGAAAGGAPVRTGTVFRATLPAVTDGQCVDMQGEPNGALLVSLQGWGTSRGDTAFRVPVITKTAPATAAGLTALWTPTSGKKVRLMRFLIQVTQDAAAAAGGVITIDLRDGAATVIASVSVFVPNAAATTFGSGYTSGWIDLGNGVLGALANNVLNLNLSAALTSGTVRAICCGTEE